MIQNWPTFIRTVRRALATTSGTFLTNSRTCAPSSSDVRFTPEKRTLSLPKPSCVKYPSRTLSHEPENLHDSSQPDLWNSSAVPCVTNFSWLAGRSRRLDGTDVGYVDRSRRFRRLELLRNKPRHA